MLLLWATRRVEWPAWVERAVIVVVHPRRQAGLGVGVAGLPSERHALGRSAILIDAVVGNGPLARSILVHGRIFPCAAQAYAPVMRSTVRAAQVSGRASADQPSMQQYRVVMVGGTQLDVDDHEMALIRATAAAALNGEATPIISVMVSAADGTSMKGPMINVLQVVSIDEVQPAGG
jgi:hypothetical protein